MAASVCSRCGSPLAPNAQFCSRCGAAIVGPAPTFSLPNTYPGPPGAAYPPGTYPSGAYPMYPPQPTASEERPTGAGVLGIIGGVFMLLGGIVETLIGGAIASVTLGEAGGLLVILGAVGCVVAIIVIILGILLLSNPDSHVTYGVVLIVLALVSLPTAAGGGFLIGFILGLIGGILAITWKPSAPVYVVYSQGPYR